MRGRGKADETAAARIRSGPRETPETSLLHVYGCGPLAPNHLGNGGGLAATLARRNRAQSTESQDWRLARDHTAVGDGDHSPSIKEAPAEVEAEGLAAIAPGRRSATPTPASTSADRAARAATAELELEFPDAQPPPPEEDDEEAEAAAEAGADAVAATAAEGEAAQAEAAAAAEPEPASSDPAAADAPVADDAALAEFPDEQPPPPDDAEFPDEQPPPPEDDEEEEEAAAEAEQSQAQEPAAAAAAAAAAATELAQAEAKSEAAAEVEAQPKAEPAAEAQATLQTPEELQPVDTPSPVEVAAAVAAEPAAAAATVEPEAAAIGAAEPAAAAAAPTVTASEAPPSDVPVIDPAPAAAAASPRRIQLSNLMHTERDVDSAEAANGGGAAESKHQQQQEPAEVEEEEVILLNGRAGRPARSTRRPEGSAAADAAAATVDPSGSPRAAQPALRSPSPPKTFAQSVATRFLALGDRPVGSSFTPPKEEEMSVSASALSPGFTAPPPLTRAAPALTAFTVFMEGYLKRKAMIGGGARSASTVSASNASGAGAGATAPQGIHVVRGQAGQRLYLVWHSKGLSGYPSQDAYQRDQKPDIHFVNSWNKRTAAAAAAAAMNAGEIAAEDEEREEKELMMVPYSTSSSSNLKQAQKDMTLLRLLLCFPSALKAGGASDSASHAAAVALAAQSSTVMILKAPSAETRNLWLAASSRIHQHHARSRHVHTKLLPLLSRMLDDPQTFLQAHAPPKPKGPPVRLTAARDDDDEPNPFSPPSQSAPASSFSSTSAEQQLLRGFHSPPSNGSAGGGGRAGDPAASPKQRLSVIASVEREEDEDEDEDEDGEALAKRSPAGSASANEGEGGEAADAVRTPTKAAAAAATSADPDGFEGTNGSGGSTRPARSPSISHHSPSLSLTDHSELGLPGLQGMGLTTSMVLALQSGNDAALSAPIASEEVAADAASALPSTAVEFWALNGETPLFPDLPLQDVSAYAMPGSGFGPAGTASTNAGSSAFGASSNGAGGDASKPPGHARSMSSPRFSTFRESGGGGAASGSLLAAGESGGSPKSAASQSPAVGLELLGPRRLMVEELLALIVLHFPGSACLSALEAALMTDNLTLPASPGPSTRALTLACFSSENWSRPHMSFAFLLFRGAFMDCSTLLSRLQSFWRWAATTVAAAHDPSVEVEEPRYVPEGAWIDKHAVHHIQANVLWMLLTWIVHFRRDYLAVQDEVDAWLRGEIYPFVSAWEKAGQRHAAKDGEKGECVHVHAHVEEPLTCAENVRIGAGALSSSQFARDAARTLLPARCVNLTLLAAQISSTIAHTSGSNHSVLASFIKTPLPSMSPATQTAVAPQAHRRGGSISLTSMGSSRALMTTDGSAATSAAASSTLSPRSSGRTVASPLMRRESYRNLSRSSLDLSSSMPPLQLQDSGSNLLSGAGAGASPPQSGSGAGEGFPALHSQSHRLPAALARKQSLVTFLKKFVTPSGESLRLGILAFTPRQIAAELTNVDVEQMQCIYTRELTHKAWTGSKSSLGALGVPGSAGVRGSIAHLTSAHVLQVIESFNRRSFWVASEILRANENSAHGGAGTKESISPDHDSTWAARVKMLEFFISLLDELRLLCNFAALFAILNGLALQPVHRLEKLWAAVNPRSFQKLQQIREGVCSARQNHASYRSEIRKLLAKRGAFIPHFGILLKDLFLLEEMASFAAVPVTIPGPAVATGASASSSAASAAAPGVNRRSSSHLKFAAAPHLQWSKWSRQYVEIYNSVLLCQANVARYEQAQIVKESSEVQMEREDAADAAATAGSRSPSAGSPRGSSGGSSSVVRPALPPSDPSLRMTLHVCFARVLNDAALAKYSYRCQPKRTA